MMDNYNCIFEEHDRGLTELLRLRLRQYLPFLLPLSAAFSDAPALDLGCRCKEWRDLLAKIGLKSSGVDFNGETSRCGSESGVFAEIRKTHVSASLSALSADSQIIVSAFHLVESLSFEQLYPLFSESLRVLKPGGLLIIENCNMEIIKHTSRKLSSGFHPIPPPLLFHLAAYCGFARVKTLKFQTTKDLIQSASCPLDDVLKEVNSVYAIVAQKKADETILKLMDAAFNRGGAVNLQTRMELYIDRLEAKAGELEIRAREAETRAYEVWLREQKIGARAQEAEAKAEEASQLLNAIYSSRSWRITAPIRWFTLHARPIGHELLVQIKTLAIKLCMPLAKRAVSFIKIRSGLGEALINIAIRLGVYDFLRSRYRKFSGHSALTVNPTSRFSPMDGPLDQMTPRARSIHADLIAAVKRNKEVG